MPRRGAVALTLTTLALILLFSFKTPDTGTLTAGRDVALVAPVVTSAGGAATPQADAGPTSAATPRSGGAAAATPAPGASATPTATAAPAPTAAEASRSGGTALANGTVTGPV